MKRILALLFLVVVVGAAAMGYNLWQGGKPVSTDVGGIPNDEIATKYLTAADRFIDVGGARVRVREEGAAGSPVILLIHGFTHSLETWDAWAADLSADYRVVRYDLLGHGLTGPDPMERYAPVQRAELMGELIDALELDDVFIAGNSLGGLAAWRLASLVPEEVRGLILISPGAFSLNGVSDTPAEIPAAMKAYLLLAPEAGVRGSAALIYGDDSKITEARIESMHDMLRRGGNGQAMIRSLEKFTLPDPTMALAQIETPTLILWGADDIIIPPEQGDQLVSAMPNARLIKYPGVGHAAQEEAPEATVRDARAFIEELRAADAE